MVAKLLGSTFIVSTSTYTFATEEQSLETENIEVLGSRMSGKQSAKIVTVNNTLSQSLESLLSLEPEIQLNSNSGTGSINEIYLRGADSNYTLMSFNGIPLNDGTNNRGGVADISFLSNVNINRIEIARGAQSSVYGSQALAGAIDFIAEPNASANEANLSIRTRLDSKSGYLLGATADYGQLLIDASTSRAPETYQDSKFESQTFTAVAMPSLDSGLLKVTLLANKAKAQSFGDDSGGARFSVTGELEERESEDINFGVRYDTDIQKGLFTVSGFTQVKKEDVATPSIPPGLRDPQGFPTSNADNKLTRSNITSYYQKELGDFKLLFGADYTAEKGESKGILDFQFFQAPTDFSLDREIIGVFTELDFALSSNINAHFFARYDDAEDENAFSPGVKIAWQVKENHELELEWGKGFKLPSFYALGNPLIGNNELKSEESETLAMNYFYTSAFGQFTLTVFDNEYTNLVDFDPGPPPQLVNRDSSFSKGAELSFRSNKTKSQLMWQANYSYTDSGAGKGNILLGRSRHRANIQLSQSFPVQQIEVSLNLKYLGTQFSSSIPTGQQKLEASLNADLILDWQASSNILLGVRLDNLLNDKLENTIGNRHTGRVVGGFLEFTL